jgi:hypothetical protein
MELEAVRKSSVKTLNFGRFPNSLPPDICWKVCLFSETEVAIHSHNVNECTESILNMVCGI